MALPRAIDVEAGLVRMRAASSPFRDVEDDRDARPVELVAERPDPTLLEDLCDEVLEL
jgi:hypothetical protein